MRRLKIVLFHTMLPESERKLGGVDVAVQRLAKAFSKPEDVTVFSLTPPPEGATYDHVHLFQQLPALRSSRLLRLYLLPWLLNRLAFRRFGVLHLHGDAGFYIRRAVLAVRTLHGAALYEARSATSLKRRLSQYSVYRLEHVSARLATAPLAADKETASRHGEMVDDSLLAGRFCWLLDSPGQRKRLEGQGSERAAESSWQAVADQRREVYRAAIHAWQPEGVLSAAATVPAARE